MPPADRRSHPRSIREFTAAPARSGIRVAGFMLCAALALAGRVGPAATAPRTPPDSIVTEVLGTLPTQFSDRFITGLESVRDSEDVHVQARRRMFLSADGLHMAFVLDMVTSRTMFVDGVRGQTYGYVSRGVFSREGGHFAHFAGPSEKAGPTLVLDGREIVLGVYASGSLSLSADGRHWAFVGRTRAERLPPYSVVSDHGGGSPYDSIGALVLSWDGSHLGYVARLWERSIVVIDGVESPRFDEATAPIFDLSGKHTAYACRSGATWSVVHDGKQGEAYASLDPTSLRFSADGTRLAYVARIGAGSALVVNGEPGGLWSAIRADSSCFTRDGLHTQYWATAGSGGSIVVRDSASLDHRETGCFGTLAVSEDGRRIAYTECVPPDRRWRVVREGIPGPDFESVRALRLSADGARVAYVVRRGDFEAAIVDGRMGPDYMTVGDPIFSADGRHEAYIAWIKQDRARVVFDGREGPEFEWIAPTGPTFLPDGTLKYLAVRHSELVRVSRVPRAGE